MVKKYRVLLLLFIIAVAGILRLWQLGSVPASPDWDEAALGYNAYSLLQTGKDEYGKSFPIVLQSFGDYKPALYAYLVIPFVVLFDLTVFAVRLPSALLGIGTVLATYYLVKLLFKREDVSLLSAFLLAISPWHLQFSRVAFEANVGLAFNVFAVVFFLKGLKKHWMLSLSFLFFALAPYAYQSDKVFSPLLALVLVIIYRKELFAMGKKYLFTAFFVGLIAILPMVIFSLTNQQAFARAEGVSIFAQHNQVDEQIAQKLNDDKNNNDVTGKLFDNRRIQYGKEIIAGYLDHFDLDWLFLRGDAVNRHHAPWMGLLYLWELPFVLLGVYMLVFDKLGNGSKRTSRLIIAWFLLAPLPAAVTTGVPHAVRTLNFLPMFQIFTAIGFVSAFVFVIKSSTHKVTKWLLLVCFLLVACFNFVYYLNQYYVQQNYYYSQDWQYGYQAAVAEVAKREGQYEKIIVANSYPLDQSYIFFLFYLKYPPQNYQEEHLYQSGNNHSFGKYEFRPIDWTKENRDSKNLYIGRPEDFPQDKKDIKLIRYIDGKPALRLVEG